VADVAAEGRSVTVVLVDDDGVVGQLPVLDVATPWWQEVDPIVAAFPGLAVLRLLSASPAPGMVAGGRVTYLAERLPAPLAPATSRSWPVRPWPGTLHEDELRLPWAAPGGPAADLEWAASHVLRTGPPRQHRTWNLSAIWTIPTTDGDVWLKCVPPFSQHESVVLELLAGFPVPTLLAASGHRQLLAAMPGENGYDATLAERYSLIDELVALQVSTIERTYELLAAGVPDGRWSALLQAAGDVVERRLPQHLGLRRLLHTADARVAAIDACGVPDALVHGDAHGGNGRVGPGTGRGIWFDWGDARIGNPLLDVGVVERPGAPFRTELLGHWLEAWRNAVPGSDPHTAWALVRPLAALGAAVVYQGFLDRIEASERVYHCDDVVPCLRLAAELAAASEGT